LLAIILLIAPFRKLKAIMSRVVFLALAMAPNIASKAPCPCYALIASVLLNVKAKALLKSFLALAIRSSPPS
jgi:hypothetical protein